MPYRLLKHGKEHIGVINLDFKLDSIKHSAGLQTGDNSEEVEPKQRITVHAGYEVWEFEVISINSASSTDLFLASFAIHHFLSCPQ